VILVTGGTGMLGRFVVLELQRRALPVRVLARASSAEKARALGVEVIVGDLCNADSLRLATSDTTGIVHVACDFKNHEANVTAMHTLLEGWNRGPLVFISSVSVYGPSRYVPTDEAHPLEADGEYGKAKVRCEQLLEHAAQVKSRTDFSILRPPHIWGPDPCCLREGTMPHTLLAQILAGAPVALPGRTPEGWAQFGDDWMDSRELAWTAAECLKRPLGGAANAINSHFTWIEFCQEIKRLTNSSSRLEHCEPDGGFFAQPWRYIGKKLQQQLGFRQQYHWQDVLANIINGPQEVYGA
jgi:nucleoside-diphosphate-sugar epimerase